jgi:hypothetical protein
MFSGEKKNILLLHFGTGIARLLMLRFQQAISERKIVIIVTRLLFRSRRDLEKKHKNENEQNIPQGGLHAGGNYDRCGHHRPVGGDRDS